MIVRIYSLAICFLCVAVLLVALPIFAMGSIQSLSPESTIRSYYFERLRDNDKYWEASYRHKEGEVERPSEEALTMQRENELESALKVERRDGVRLIQSTLMFILTSILFYVLHWRLYKRVEYAK